MKNQRAKLTERQAAILRRMQRLERQHGIGHCPETGPEMVEALWASKAFTSVEQGQRACKQLSAKGLVEPLGFGADGGRCWGITAAGRRILKSKS